MSTTTIDLDEKTYGKLLRRTLPHVIHTDEECERLTSELMRLDEREDLSPEEAELAELLTVLIDEYEQRRYPIAIASPQQTLQAFNGSAPVDSERPLEDLRLERHHFRGVSRQAFHKQNAGQEARRVFPRRRGPIHLGPPARSRSRPTRENQLDKSGN